MAIDFVDRGEDLAQLRAMAGALAQGRGGALVVEGVSGMGKSSLLAEFARQLEPNSPRAPYRVARAHCLPGIGSGLLYGPIVDILVELRDQSAQTGRWRRALGGAARGAARSAPDALSAIVPGLGAAWSMGREVTTAALRSGAIPFDSLLPFQQGAAVQIAQRLLAFARSGPPTVVLIDDLQFIDPGSLQILDLLLKRLDGEPLALVLGCATGGRSATGPGAAVAELIGSWTGARLIRRRPLSGLPSDAVAELVRRRHPAAPPELPAMLSTATNGHPVFVSLCLEAWHPDNGATVPLPDSLAAVVEELLTGLDDQDRRLVELAAVQGVTFLSRVLAEAAGLPHDHVIERLRRLAHTRQLICAEEPGAWAAQARSDGYRFEHLALWEVVYGLQSPEQRRSRHERIAAALRAGDGWPDSLAHRLEVARHLELGGAPCLEAAAEAHYALAWSAAVDGLSFAEAERHCAVAIRAARALPPANAGRDRLLVSAIELLLSLTEVRWRGQRKPAGGLPIDELAAEAEQAAARCAVPELIARTALLRGKTLMATRGLEPSLAKLKQAVELAAGLADPVALFVAKVEYGRQVSKRRLADGLAQLREAERMYAAEPALGGADNPLLQHARNFGEMQLGITLFDSGLLSEARARLLRCTARLREEQLNAQLPIALNYLAQVQLSLGSWPAAEATLREARDFEARRGGDSGWHAYNSALLAVLLAADPARRAESLDLIGQAWEETERTWLVNLVPIVRNLYAEVLLATAADDPGRLEQADRLAVDTCVETRETGMVRSEIAALSLRGRIGLRRGDVRGARGFADAAVRLLDKVGEMPALRTEEVLFHAAAVLDADGSAAAAGELLARARAEIRRKAGHIDDPAERRAFLADVPLNRRVLSGQPFAQSH